MAGTLTIDTLKASSGVLATQNGMTGIAKAWVNFDGTTSPPTIAASFNVGSITKNGTGDYTVNFTTTMPNANYSMGGMVKYPDTSGGATQTTIMIARVASPITTTSARFLTGQSNSTAYDCNPVCVMFISS